MAEYLTHGGRQVIPSRGGSRFTVGSIRDNVVLPAGIAGSAPLFDKTTDSSPLELLTVHEAADLFKVSASTIRRLQQARKIPFVKVGGGIRFLASDLYSYIAKARVAAIGK